MKAFDSNINLVVDNWKETTITISKEFEIEIHKLHDIYQEVTIRNSHLQNDVFSKTYISVYNDWVSKEDSGKDRLKKLFIDKFEPFCKDYINQNKDDILAFNSLKNIQMLDFGIIRKVANNDLVSKRIQEISERLSKDYSKVSESLRILSTQKFKNVIFIK